MLDALSCLGREAGRKRLARLIRQYAPTWLAQLPGMLSATEREKVRRASVGVTGERMLRELAEAVEVLTAQVGLVLWIDDMQWSDPSTLAWVGYVARRAGPARLLVVGTCRPVAGLEQGHPLRVLTQELLLYRQGVELELRGLTVSAVFDYLCRQMRYEECGACHTLARAMHQRTEGHPLFLVNVLKYLRAQGALTPCNGPLDLQGALALIQQEVPPRLQQLMARQLVQLHPEEQRLLDVASVAGTEFSAAAVAAGLESSMEEVEERCAALARRALFVKPCGMTDWPDGTVATRYAFRHALYTYVLYERLPASRCRDLHERLGRRIEQAYGVRAREVAAELALHYEWGRQYGRAIHYLQQAGENASRRSAHPEAISLLSKGLDLLQMLPETSERTQQALQLLLALGASLIVVKGYAAPEVEDVYTRTYALCQQSSDTRQLLAALLGLSGMYHNRAEYQKVRDLTQQMLRIAQEAGSATCQLWAYVLLGQVLYQTGEFALAQQHYLQSLALYDDQRHSPYVSDITQDPRAHCLANLAEALWLCGYPDQALQRSQEALAWARRPGHPYSLVVVLSSTALVHSWRGEFRAAGELAEEHIALARAHGFPFWLAVGTIRQGWAVVAQGHPEVGVTQMRQGWAALQATGTKLALAGLLSEFAWALGVAGEGERGWR